MGWLLFRGLVAMTVAPSMPWTGRDGKQHGTRDAQRHVLCPDGYTRPACPGLSTVQKGGNEVVGECVHGCRVR